MDPLLISAAALAIQEGISLVQQYSAGTPGADVALQQWVASVSAYKAAKAAFDAAGPAAPPRMGSTSAMTVIGR